MTGYAVVLEHEGGAWGAYVPDLPGCVGTGVSRDEVKRRIREAIPAHVALMRESGEAIPPPTLKASSSSRPRSRGTARPCIDPVPQDDRRPSTM